jgi:putative hydrolase of HD superfamily
MEEKIKTVFEFFKLAEKLKVELRHSYTSNIDRRESTAEHSWMLLLMAIVLMDKVKEKIDKLKVLKMLIIHDLAEVLVGDIPSHEVSLRQDKKQISEAKAMKTMTKNLEPRLGSEIVDLWEEFEAKSTREAKFAYAMDKFECLFQHNVADIKTWDEADYRYTFIDKQDIPFDYDDFMRLLKNNLDDWTYSKVKTAGTLKRVPEENLKRYQKRKRKVI